MQIKSPHNQQKDFITLSEFKNSTQSLLSLDVPLNIGVGVSGGADSMALTLLIKEYLDAFANNNYKLIAFTVNHKLRPSSTMEAAWVGRELKKHNVEHKILTWEGKKPTSKIEETAREVRYGLLLSACQKYGLNYLFIAHNLEDCVETFFLRLCRKSGVDGLASIRPLILRNNVRVCRPLLNFSRARLLSTLQRFKQSWVEDESNSLDKFTRVRWRKFLPQLDKMGLSSDTILAVMQKQAQVSDYFKRVVEKFLTEYATFSPLNYITVDWDAFVIQDREVRRRILQTLLMKIGDEGYPPATKKLENLDEKIMTDNLKLGTTLHGTKVMKKKHKILIVRELKKNVLPLLIAEKQENVNFSGFNFSLPHEFPKGSYVATLGKQNGIKFDNIPTEALWTLPAIFSVANTPLWILGIGDINKNTKTD